MKVIERSSFKKRET